MEHSKNEIYLPTMTVTPSNMHNTSDLEFYRCCCGKFKIGSVSKLTTLMSALTYAFFVLLYSSFFTFFFVLPFMLGILIYWTLYLGVFRGRHTMLIPYLVFEVIGVVCYLMLAIWLSLLLMAVTQSVNEESQGEEHVSLGWMLFLILSTLAGVGLKVWYLTVIMVLYRYLRFKNAYGGLVYAQYMNGGVQINAGSDMFPAPPPFTPSANAGYTIPANGNEIPILPSYDDAMSVEKPSAPPRDSVP